jgi:hypothetical protein
MITLLTLQVQSRHTCVYVTLFLLVIASLAQISSLGKYAGDAIVDDSIFGSMAVKITKLLEDTNIVLEDTSQQVTELVYNMIIILLCRESLLCDYCMRRSRYE